VDRGSRLVEIDPETGAQSLLSQGVAIVPTGVAVESPGHLLITDFYGSLLRFDVASGSASILASGGLIGEVHPFAVQVDADGTIIVSGLAAGGNAPSRVIRVDPVSGAQSLIAESMGRNFYDFALPGAFIAMSWRGYPSGQDMVSKLNLATGQLTPIVAGLQSVLDVDIAPDGDLVVLDGILSLPCCPPWVPVIYRTTQDGGPLTIVTQGGHLFAPGRLVIIPTPHQTDQDGDGVLDDLDLCPDTPQGVVVNAHGCSINQLVPCAGPLSGGAWRNHGQYVSQIAKTAEAFLADGLITEELKDAVVDAAARSECGTKAQPRHGAPRGVTLYQP
jgi:hypothetical protein